MFSYRPKKIITEWIEKDFNVQFNVYKTSNCWKNKWLDFERQKSIVEREKNIRIFFDNKKDKMINLKKKVGAVFLPPKNMSKTRKYLFHTYIADPFT